MARRRRSSPPSAASGSASSGPTAPARRRSCARSPATCRRSTGRSRSATRSSPAYLAQLRDAAIPGATVLDALLEAIPVTPGEARGVPRPVPVPRRRRVQGGPLAVGRRAVAPRAGAARASCRPTCCCSTSRRTTSTSPPARRSRRSWSRSPATLLVVSHDRRLLETICEKLWVVDDGMAVAVRRRVSRLAGGGRRRAGPSAAEAKRRANRGRPGGRRRAGASTPRCRRRPRRGDAVGVPARRDHRRPPAPRPKPGTKLSKDAYRRRREAARRRAAPPGPPQDASWSWRWRPGRGRELRGDAAGDERARRRGAGAGARPRTPGWSWRSRHRDDRTAHRPHRDHRADRLRQVAGRRGWLAELGVHVVDADRVARAVTSPGTSRARPRPADGSVRRWSARTGRWTARRSAGSCSRIPPRSGTSRRSSTRPSGPGSSPRSRPRRRPGRPPWRSRRSSWSRAGWRPRATRSGW